MQRPPRSIRPTGTLEAPLSTPLEPATRRGRAADTAERSRLVGLYHGYDEARRALARIVCELGGAEALEKLRTRQHPSSPYGRGLSDLFEPPAEPGREIDLAVTASSAHSAALSAFAAISEKAESTLARICRRWPELRGELGGPLSTEHVPFDDSTPC